MPASGIAFTMYPVSDVPRAVAFYRDKLGFRQDGMNEEWWVEFAVGTATFGIGNVPDNGKPGTAQSLVVEVLDLGAYVKELAQRGVPVGDIHNTPYNCSITSVRDPDGNTVWFHEKKEE